MIKDKLKNILVDKINNSLWWHVPPRDPDAYKQRGKFLASTYLQAEFYGRPNNVPEKVKINNPVYGYSEKEILEQLFPNKSDRLSKRFENPNDKDFYRKRITLDRIMFIKAKKIGYDSIVLLTVAAKQQLKRNIKPKSIELNIFDINNTIPVK